MIARAAATWATLGTTASVQATYPNPGPDALEALPRLVLDGAAKLIVRPPPYCHVLPPSGF